MEQRFFEEAVQVARKALCLRRRCGAVVVKNGEVIGRGYNAPPGDDASIRRCQAAIDKNAKYPTDKTCCIHAEQRAVLDALQNYPRHLQGSEAYFISINEQDQRQFTGEPYCTICSKIMLDLGVKTFHLWHRSGIKSYEMNEYNELCFASNNKTVIVKDGK